MGQGQVVAPLEERYFVQKVKLGQGSFGTVWRAVDRKKGNTVAIKQLDKASLPRRGVTRQDIDREIKLMRAVQHENVTQLFDTFEDERSIFLALEYCEDGDFGDKVRERGSSIAETEVAEWVKQMCASICALHTNGICHRDIKPDNFMVSGATLKLSDFGLATFLPRGRLLQEKCGTPAFMAPEQHYLPARSPGYGYPADIWAAGVSMYMVMFGGRHPFLTDSGRLDEKLLMSGTMDFRDRESYKGLFAFGNIGMRFSEDARWLCKRMVEPDPSRRISATSVMRRPWLHAGTLGRGSVASQPTQLTAEAHASEASGTPRNSVSGSAPRTPQSNSPSAAERRARRAQTSPPAVAEDEGRSEAGKDGQGLAPAELQALEEEAAKLKDQNQTLQLELEERRRKEQELEQETRNLKEQHTLLQKQRTQELELQNERMKEQELQLQRIEQEKKELMERQRSHSQERRGRQAAPIRPGHLSRGSKCRYESGTYGWLSAVVQDYNESDGTYNLDVRPHAALDKISPAAEAKESEAWPAGTLAQYLSASAGQWLPAVVVSYNVRDDTYNLDVRDHADLERIRARAVDQPVSDRPSEDVAGLAFVAPSKASRGTPCSTASTSASSTGAIRARPTMCSQTSSVAEAAARSPSRRDPTPSIPLRLGDLEANVLPTSNSASPKSSAGRVGVGERCVAPEHGLVLIEAMQEGTYAVRCQGGRRAWVAMEAARAPAESRYAWAPGTKVAYQSSSYRGQWIDAKVVSFNPSSSTYNLDVKMEAPPDNIRPR